MTGAVVVAGRRRAAVSLAERRATRVAAAGLVSVLLVAVAVLAVPGGGASRPQPARRGATAAPPSAVRLLVSAAMGRDDGAYAARLRGGVATLANGPHRLDARFSRRGLALRADGLRLGLRLVAAGSAEAPTRVAAARPAVARNRVTLAHPGIDEWFVNGPAGLEQGFTVRRRPVGAGDLALVLGVRGDARLRADPGGRGLTIAAGHRVALRYDGLTARDAGGRRLGARMRVTRGRITFLVADRTARYPVTVDPLYRAARLTSSDGHPRDYLGASLATSGDLVVAGAPSADDGLGAVYVFQRPVSGGWTDAAQVARVTASVRASGDALGSAVALDGDTIAAGAPGGSGAVYVFKRPAGGWRDGHQDAKLTLPGSPSFTSLGTSVALQGTTLVAGSPGSGSWDAGAVQVFNRPADGWHDATPNATLTASDAGTYAALGSSVALMGNVIVSGAPYSFGYGSDPGNAYVFVRPTGGWQTATQTAKLTATGAVGGDIVGTDVAIDGDTIAVGAPTQYRDSYKPGAVYVYSRPAGGWANATQTAMLIDARRTGYSWLGRSLAFDAQGLLATADREPNGGSTSVGTVYRFTRPAGGWVNATETSALTLGVGSAGDGLGQSAAYAAGTTVSSTLNGAVYVWEQDDVAPDAPIIADPVPAPPANDNAPRLRGDAEPNATIRVYAAADCSGAPIATGTATALSAGGLTLAVPDDSVTALSVTATDRAGNVSACSAPVTYVEDSTAPQTVVDDGPSGATDDPTPTFRFHSDDPRARFACSADGAGATPCSSPLTLAALGEGSHPFAVQAVDAAGNADGTPAERRFVVDTSAPAARIAPSTRVAVTGQPVSFDASGSSDPPAGTIIDYAWDLDGDGSFETHTGTTPTATRSYSMVGDVNAGVLVTDQFGRVGTERVPVAVRAAPPKGRVGVAIAGGAKYTRTPRVVLDVVWPTGAKDIVIANDGGFRDATTVPVQARVDWVLATSGSERSKRTVYVRFDGDPAQTFTARILLDRTPPRIRSLALAGHRLVISATDSLSGVETVQMRSAAGGVTTVRYRPRVRVPAGLGAVRVGDGAGNYSRWRRAPSGRRP